MTFDDADLARDGHERRRHAPVSTAAGRVRVFDAQAGRGDAVLDAVRRFV